MYGPLDMVTLTGEKVLSAMGVVHGAVKRMGDRDRQQGGGAAPAITSSLPAWACCLWPGSPASTWVVPSTRNSTEHRGQVSFQHCSVPLLLSSAQARHRG